MLSDWSKTHRKSVLYCFLPHNLQSTFLLEKAKNKFFKEIRDGVLYEAAESFDAEISITNKEMFSTFCSSSHMAVVFYHSVIHGLGFFIC